MKITYIVFILIINSIFAFAPSGLSAQKLHHDLHVKLNIAAKSIEVIDTMYISLDKAIAGTANFKLNKNLIPQSLNPMIKISKVSANTDTAAMNIAANNIAIEYKLELPAKAHGGYVVPIRYAGRIDGGIKAGAAEYARGFSSTNGIISDSGVYLAGSTYWVPAFENQFFTFNLDVNLNMEWNVMSQGTRTVNNVLNNRRNVRYESDNPMDEVYLISMKWTEFSQMAGDVEVQAFLRQPDEKLANRYLGATQKYLDTYIKLIGPYPYSKFALVENFWETGYGMPSFTLLGEKVIRFPFILYTSYPHELLHNWWGNSVYVDYEKGNWCEGLTAYMADHLMKERQGKGADYRRNALQKYTNHVQEYNDFPIAEFRSRNNPAEEAIGYGKVLMVNHMLRKEFGDENFINAYKMFYNEYKFKIASFDDIRRCFERVAGADLRSYFYQWIMGKGAPEIELSSASVVKKGSVYEIDFTLSQNQKGNLFDLRIPVAVYLENDNEVKMKTVKFKDRTRDYKLSFDKRPVRITVDPMFDVFRRLDLDEIPATLSQTFGAKNAILILPKKSKSLKEYKAMAGIWKKSQQVQGKSMDVVYDKDLSEIPKDKAVWIIGYENKFAAYVNIVDNYKGYLSPETIIQFENLSKTGALVYAVPNPKNKKMPVCFIGSRIKEAIPGLARKLPHYGKYGYLGFEGKPPTNVLKGELPVINSPMTYEFKYNGVKLTTTAIIPPEKPLAE